MKSPKAAVAWFAAMALASMLFSCSEEKTEHVPTPVSSAVSGISPDFGPVSGGTPVTIFGYGFGSGAAVTIGGTAAASIVYVSSTEITCTTPAGSAGPADVAVGGMVLTGGFTYADWQFPAWTRRAPITVTGSTAGALSDFQLRLTIPFDTDMKADFSDLRFTQSSGGSETPLPHWLESATASTQAYVWVKMPSIPASPSTATVYAYYGNASASSASDFDSTFAREYGETGLLGLWHLDEAEGVDAADSSGLSNDAVLTGFQTGWGWTPWDGGGWGTVTGAGFASGSAIALDGETALVTANYDPSMDLGEEFTVEAWVRAYAGEMKAREGAIASRAVITGSKFNTAANWSKIDPGPTENLWDYGPAVPVDLELAAAAVSGGKIYISGGRDETSAALNTLYEYDPATGSFTPRAAMATARFRHGLVAAVSGKLYAIGGTADGSAPIATGTVEEYDPSTNAWTTMTGEMPTPRFAFACALDEVSGYIYAVGGDNGSSLANADRYNPVTNTWDSTPTDYPVTARNIAGASQNGLIYVCGGQNVNTPLSSFYVYDPTPNSWTILTPIPAGSRYTHSVLAAGGKIYVIGGSNGSTSLRYVETYDVATATWTRGTDTIDDREGSASAIYNNRIHLFGRMYRPGTTMEISGGLEAFGFDPDGFWGAVFDGRYVYLVPDFDGTSYSGAVVRYDTRGGLDRSSSWAAFDPSANSVGTDPRGFIGAAFDGRYVYFAPYYNTDRHGEVLRYDTASAFDAAASWAAYDPGSNGVGTDPDGYSGAVFDGRYLYFSPRHNGTTYSGEVLRFDTTAAFNSSTSWTTFDPSANGVGTDPAGFMGAVWDGRFVYFIPYSNQSDYNGEVLRYDTTGQFASAGSWTAFDPGANGLGTDPDGYLGAAFDGRYIYFAPSHDGNAYHGEVLRLDTRADFASLDAWSVCDPGTLGVGTDPDGYWGACFDGRYVYFAPRHNGTTYGTEVLRLDTTAEFSSSAAWSTCDFGAMGLGAETAGMSGTLFDGRHVYFVPYINGQYHGTMVRYDAAPDSLWKISWAGTGGSGGNASNPEGLLATFTTIEGDCTLRGGTALSDGAWHHVSLTYDNGAGAVLYVDGASAATAQAAGVMKNSNVNLVLGGFMGGKARFRGEIDEVRFYGRALSAAEVKAHSERRKFASPEPATSAPGAEETR